MTALPSSVGKKVGVDATKDEADGVWVGVLAAFDVGVITTFFLERIMNESGYILKIKKQTFYSAQI